MVVLRHGVDMSANLTGPTTTRSLLAPDHSLRFRQTMHPTSTGRWDAVMIYVETTGPPTPEVVHTFWMLPDDGGWLEEAAKRWLDKRFPQDA